MSTRHTLPLVCLITLFGVLFFLSGCTPGDDVNLPDDVYIHEDLRVPSLTLPNLNNEANGDVLVGTGSSFKIAYEAINPPTNATVKFYLDDDGKIDNSSILICPTQGVPATDKYYNFIPTRGLAPTGVKYFLIAQLFSSSYIFDTAVSKQKILIGDGGIVFTNPTTNITLARGLAINVTWDVTNNICEDIKDKSKTLKLYVDTYPDYKEGRSMEATPTQGIDACLKQYELKTGEVKGLQLDTSYYIIGRLFMDDMEHSRTSTTVTFKTTSSLTAIAPQTDTESNLQAVMASWAVVGRDPVGLKIEILAEKEITDPNSTAQATVSVISNEFPAEQGSGVADGSKLPVGTYHVLIRLFEYNESGAKVILDTAQANGRIIVTGGYSGSYDLADMEAIVTRNYSPIDGVIFEGFNRNDQAGFEVAGIGDQNNDKVTDFLIFTRYGQEYSTGKAGSAYLIYGKKEWSQPVINLNSVAAPGATTRPVNGTLILMPLENNSTHEGPNVAGSFRSYGTPDISGDKKGDLLIGCPEAAPLQIWYVNHTGGATTFTDHYGLPRTLPNDSVTRMEPGHVHSFMQWIVPDGTVYWRYYPQDYQGGDIIYVHAIGDPGNPHLRIDIFPVHERRGSTYLLTSQRLEKYVDKVFDMSKVGSPATLDTDGLDITSLAYDQMLVWSISYPDVRFGADLSMLPDRDGDGYPEYIISAPQDTVTDTAQASSPERSMAGMAVVFQSQVRWRHLFSSPNGNIGWNFSGTDKTSFAWNSYHDQALVNIFGPSVGSELTGVAGLGRFADMTSYASYTSGDFNGDNVPDIVAGTPGESNNAGAVFIIPIRPVLGHRVNCVDLADFNVSIDPQQDPSLEVPIIGLKIKGTVAGERLGAVVKPAGDFNGDGLADVMFTTPSANGSGRAEAGRLFIVFGQPNEIGDYTIEDVSSLKGTQVPGLIFEGQAPFDHFGTRIICAQDVNGDGVDDILVAAPDADAPGKNDCGKIYVIYGKKNIVKVDPATKFKYVDYDGDGKPDEFWSAQDLGNKLAGAVFIGAAAGDHLQAISHAGDVNGDGIGDFILGSPQANVNSVQLKAGKAYLVFGRKLVIP